MNAFFVLNQNYCSYPHVTICNIMLRAFIGKLCYIISRFNMLEDFS